jgi:S1-C subfamily serine protease
VTGPSRFIATRPLAGVEFVRVDASTVVESSPRLRDALQRHIGPDVALLFAEPILSRGNGSAPGRIDWYTERTGVIRSLAEIPREEASAVRARFKELSARILPLMRDPDVGYLVAAAFNLHSPASLVAVDGEPVLLDWGLLPEGLASDPPALALHHAATLVGLAPGSLKPPTTCDGWATEFPPEPTRSETSQPGPAPRLGQFALVPSSRPPVVALAVLAGLLALSYLPGVLAFPEPQTSAPGEARLVQVAWLDGLHKRRAALENTSTLDCQSLGQTLPGVIPQRPRDVRISPDPASPPRASVAVGPRAQSTGAVSPPSQGTDDLVDAIARSTVLVLAGSASGSGFFVSDELIVTNRHVVEGGGPLLVAGRHVGVLQAALVRVGSGGALEDFALLRVSRQSGARAMVLAAPGRPLTPVVAAGFPGLHMATDPIFQRLREGNAEASRSLEPVFQTGVVNHLQRQAEGVTLVVHGAEIAPGNSGGPLVDYCGRLVGVNTFGRIDDRLPITARYALGTDALASFLRSADMGAPVDGEPCVLTAPAAVQTTQAESPTPSAAPNPGAAPAVQGGTPVTPHASDRSAPAARAPSR